MVALNHNIAGFIDTIRKNAVVSETTSLFPSAAGSQEPVAQEPDWSLTNARSYGAGILIAVICGFIGGLSLVPYDYVNASQQGMVFMPAFTTGIMAVAVLTVAVFLTVPSAHHRITLKDFHLDQPIVAGMGLLSGVFLGLQFIFSFFALSILPYGVVIPIVLCSILISSALGILLFDEIKGDVAIGVFYTSSIVVLAGVFMLSY
jgi:drug/metabolite transporter (DMT)-like permease